jgi:hypothetical protein
VQDDGGRRSWASGGPSSVAFIIMMDGDGGPGPLGPTVKFFSRPKPKLTGVWAMVQAPLP